ncbi:hypothetical protein K3495_g10329 [Podosphaera aphanis]|nr:hypothetical protein K3495_g10329 [Podosphaera aphanis]
MHQYVRQFLRSCDICGQTKVWREHKKGFLKLMPIPDRYYSEISMDFTTKLPPSETPFGREQATNILAITDRLLKDVLLEALPTTDAKAVAKRFMWSYYRFHGFPRSVTSDQGPQWIGRFWKHLCKLAGVEQRLTSTYHSQTDGGTERWNQEVWAYRRAYVNYMQNDWANWLFSAQLALNNRPNSTGLSPFFITHGYYPETIKINPTNTIAHSEEKRAELYMSRLQQIQEFSQSAIAAAQQQENYANEKRPASEQYRVSDKVWLTISTLGAIDPEEK